MYRAVLLVLCAVSVHAGVTEMITDESAFWDHYTTARDHANAGDHAMAVNEFRHA